MRLPEMNRWRQQPSQRRLGLVLSMALVVITATGCFRPSGAGLEATVAAQGAPTFTPPPTNTLPPTETQMPTITPSDAPIIQPTATETPNLFVTIPPDQFVFTEVAAAPQAQTDPLILTATALAGGGQQPVFAQPTLQPTQQQVIQQPVTDPLALTATQIVAGATLTAAAPMTLTMQAILGPTATPTQSIVVPATQPVGPTTPPISGADCIHEVQSTDRNLFRISLAYGLTVQQIATASGIVNPALIYVGQRLVIPGCGTTGYRPPPTTPPTAGAPGIVVTTSPGTNVCGPIYVVQQGDTLFEISLACGVPVMTIASLNGISNINLIFINQELRLQ